MWGQTTWTGTDTPWRYPGQYHDTETGLHYNHHRYYQPHTGRYLTPDPLGLAPALNPYGYPGNPTAFADPFGLAPCDPRKLPGTATGGEGLRHVEPGERWLRGTEGNAGRVPGQVADALRGQTFNNWDHFRQEFWRAVSQFPELREQFAPGNQGLMSNGNAPRVLPEQALGKRASYEIHHTQPVGVRGGSVYDLDNMLVVTPKFHVEATLDPAYHFGTR